MQVSVVDNVIEVTIRKNLDFNAAQKLLLRCKVHTNLHPEASAKISLENVVNVRNCGIAAMSLIANWMPGGLQIAISQCSREAHQWTDFSEGKQSLLSTPPTLSCSLICNSCFDNNDYLASTQDFGDSSVHSPARSEC